MLMSLAWIDFPIIDWRKQPMYIYVNRQWDQMNGVLTYVTQSARTIKVFDGYRTCEDNNVHVWIIV